MSGRAKALVKLALAACVVFWLYDTFAMPYGGVLSFIPAAVYFVIAFAVIWVADRIVRRFADRS